MMAVKACASPGHWSAGHGWVMTGDEMAEGRTRVGYGDALACLDIGQVYEETACVRGVARQDFCEVTDSPSPFHDVGDGAC
jgi:hypothetical protein